MTDSFDHIILEQKEAVGILSFNDPTAMNAISPPMAFEIMRALDEVASPQKGMRCLILTGAGKGFCAGANLAGLVGGEEEMKDIGQDPGKWLNVLYNPILTRLKTLPMPLITAVGGAAAGIGASFALMGDMILASHKAFFVQSFANIGLVPDGGATWILPRIVGLSRARAMSMTGERIDASKALDWGMVHQVVSKEDLMPHALMEAQKLAQAPTKALVQTRALLWEGLEAPYEQHLHTEAAAQSQMSHTHDFSEGVSAFLEKRKPHFKGS